MKQLFFYNSSPNNMKFTLQLTIDQNTLLDENESIFSRLMKCLLKHGSFFLLTED